MSRFQANQDTIEFGRKRGSKDKTKRRVKMGAAAVGGLGAAALAARYGSAGLKGARSIPGTAKMRFKAVAGVRGAAGAVKQDFLGGVKNVKAVPGAVKRTAVGAYGAAKTPRATAGKAYGAAKGAVGSAASSVRSGAGNAVQGVRSVPGRVKGAVANRRNRKAQG
jgi:hypothetical protein